MDLLSRLPVEAGLILAVVGVTLGYLFLMRLLARLVDERFEVNSDWREAEHRAEVMLTEILPAQEVQRLYQRGYLEVPSRQFQDRIYRIPRHQGPVAVYEGGILTNLLCVRSVEPIPNGDAVLLHKLMLEADESGYLKVANAIRPRPYAFTA